MVIAESSPLEDIKTRKKERERRYFKIKVLDNHKAEGVNNAITTSLDEQSIVFTDKSTSYVDISDFCRTSYYRKIRYRNFKKGSCHHK